MDPREELELYRRLDSARSAGDQAAELEAWRAIDALKGGQQQKQPVSRPIGAGQSFLQGVSFGWQDELDAAANALGEGLVEKLRGNDFALGDRYAKHHAALNQQLGQYRQEHPVESTVAELGGALTSGLSLGSGIYGMKQLANLPQWMRYALSGATAGGVAGAGAAQPGERTEGALKGAGTGAVVGTVAPYAVKAIGKGVGAVARPVVEKLRGPATTAQRKILEAIQRDDMTPEKVAASLRKMGPKATLADAAGENTLGLARGAAAVPGKAKNVAARVLNERQAGQAGRVTNTLKATLGADDDFYGALDDVAEKYRAQAAPLYEKAYQAKIPVNDELKELFKRPAIQEAWKRAQRIAADEGHELPQMMARDAEGKAVGMVDVPDMKTLDYIKRGLDDVISDHVDDFGRVKGEVGRSVQKLKDRYVEVLDNLNPAYKEARNVSAGHLRNMDAMKQGRAFLSGDAEMTAKRLAKLSESEREFFRAGAMRAIRDKILGAPDTSDVYKRIFNTPLMREKLSVIFPDRKDYAKFARAMKTEAQFYRTRNTVLGGSPTARIEAEKADLLVDPSVAESAVQGNYLSAGTSLLKNLYNRARLPSEEVRTELGGLLFSNDPKRNQEILGLLGQRAQAKQLTADQLRQLGLGLLSAGSAETGKATAR